MSDAGRSEFIQVRGLRYHLRRWGDPTRPMIVLCHGLLDCSETFAPLVPPLLDRWQVLAPDWRGLGLSEWPQDGYWFPDYVADLDAVIDHVSPQQPVLLVGHSMGAQVASLYAGLRPQRVSRFVCLDGLFLPDMPVEVAPKRFRKWLDQLQALPAEKAYASYEDLAQRVRKRHPQLGETQALFVAQCWARSDREGAIRLLADPKHQLSSPGLYRAGESMEIWKQITAPVLFIDGGQSFFIRTIPAAETAQRRACFRDHREAVIDTAGHMLHFDAPEQTGRLIAEFFSG